jgi:hypothetical protein
MNGNDTDGNDRRPFSDTVSAFTGGPEKKYEKYIRIAATELRFEPETYWT